MFCLPPPYLISLFWTFPHFSSQINFLNMKRKSRKGQYNLYNGTPRVHQAVGRKFQKCLLKICRGPTRSYFVSLKLVFRPPSFAREISSPWGIIVIGKGSFVFTFSRRRGEKVILKVTNAELVIILPREWQWRGW